MLFFLPYAIDNFKDEVNKKILLKIIIINNLLIFIIN